MYVFGKRSLKILCSILRRGVLASTIVSTVNIAAQAPRSEGQAAQSVPPASLVSTEVSGNHLTFRIYAPKAETVRLNSDFTRSENNSSRDLTKDGTGVWSVTVGPVEPGTYRYCFVVDGVQTVDPKSRTPIERLDSVWSVVTVPGAEYQDPQPDVPHGALETVWYKSTTLNRMRRLHIYTPPGYSGGQGRYPVLYLQHSGGDSDDGWTAEGRANIILDNLIAAGRAKPMIVVMTATHVNPVFVRTGLLADVDSFVQDFETDAMPFVERNYRVIADRQHRAIAGSSMGGHEALDLELLHPEQFSYVGIFSSGWFEHGDAPFLKDHEDALRHAASNQPKLLWAGVGRQDTVASTVTPRMLEVLKGYKIAVDFHESEGAHNWITWRDYLILFLPKLFS